MNSLRTLMAAAAASMALSLVASPGIAQDRYDGGYGPGWHGGYEPAHGYGPSGGYGPQGYGGYGVDTGITDIAICPPRYHLGRAPGLCWPD